MRDISTMGEIHKFQDGKLSFVFECIDVWIVLIYMNGILQYKNKGNNEGDWRAKDISETRVADSFNEWYKNISKKLPRNKQKSRNGLIWRPLSAALYSNWDSWLDLFQTADDKDFLQVPLSYVEVITNPLMHSLVKIIITATHLDYSETLASIQAKCSKCLKL